MRRWMALVLGLWSAGCYESHRAPGQPCGRRIEVSSSEDLDLLFMIDDSNSMAQEQERLRAEIPRAISILAAGDRDRDGLPDFATPVRSLHVGIVTSDMGAGALDSVPSCDRGAGGDGILVDAMLLGRCPTVGPERVFEFVRATDDASAFAATVGCAADLGTGGCGFEQQLEAVLKALSPVRPSDFVSSDYRPPVFRDGTSGHGDGVNAAFLRRGSVLAIVMLTDEEDCSVPDTTLFDGDSRTFLDPLNLRCPRHPEALHPTERYVSGFLQLREDPSLLIFAPIVGIPEDLADAPFETILADPRMEERENMEITPPQRLLPSCRSEGSEATPPRRIVSVARDLAARGALTTVHSICSPDYGAAIDRIVDRIEEALRSPCLSVPFEADGDGLVSCEVYQVLPGTGPLSRCTALALEPFSVLADGRAQCRIPQLAPPSDPEVAPDGVGFWYDERSAAARSACPDVGRRLSFTGLTELRGEFRVRCDHRPPSGALGVESPCVVGVASCASARAPRGSAVLECAPLHNSCLVPCASPLDCAEAGLVSFTCDLRTNAEVAGDGSLGGLDPDAPYGFCTNAVCR